MKTRSMKAAATLAGAMVAMALVATGCSKGADTPDKPAVTEITFWSWLRASQEVTDAFNKTHTDVQVKFELESDQGLEFGGWTIDDFCVVAYDALSESPDLPVPGLITLGSPLGLPTVRRRLRTLRFPQGVARWVNVYDPRDFVTGREPLQAHFPADDGLMVEDLEIEGKAPSFLDVTASHDGRVYLSSIALARALRDMIAASSAADAETANA